MHVGQHWERVGSWGPGNRIAMRKNRIARAFIPFETRLNLCWWWHVIVRTLECVHRSFLFDALCVNTHNLVVLPSIQWRSVYFFLSLCVFGCSNIIAIFIYCHHQWWTGLPSMCSTQLNNWNFKMFFLCMRVRSHYHVISIWISSFSNARLKPSQYAVFVHEPAFLFPFSFPFTELKTNPKVSKLSNSKSTK